MAGSLRNKSFSGECWLGGSKIEAWRLQNHPRQIEAQSLQNRARSLPRMLSNRAKSNPEPPKSRLGGSKIESGALQDAIFQDIQLKRVKKEHPLLRKLRFLANLASSWKPKRLQNRGRNLKKSMLKNNTFFASIFKGFGLCFGKVFGRFFGQKIRANSETLTCVKNQQNYGWAHEI